eukprot:CAMPEP_0172329148 /NCGR_PEP_ID=MMETSP1058-20130122/60728_1 /TAXON_ID=83371 /ORGANISM="Detonula confervacea, Strain CCMP 353" /LENGTH=1223 /DNA_ID=CAMNT_0013046305 /DNA_START=38 /DNA_END=3710 /DNA_ORIENTATION=-
MSKRPSPPSRFFSSLSEDDSNDVQMPPPPPPALYTVIDDSPPTPAAQKASATIAKPLRSSPPSVLRKHNNIGGGSKNSVAFSGIMDNLNNQQQTNNSPQRRVNISLKTVINSQFENEAETHILAALELDSSSPSKIFENSQSRLLGEGLEGMEDYSDDDDDNDKNNKDGNNHHARGHTWNNDSFLKNVTMQNQLPQYQVPVGGDQSATSSAAASSPQKSNIQPTIQTTTTNNVTDDIYPHYPPAQKSNIQPTIQTTTHQQRHRRYISSLSARGGSSGYLPSVPDDAALVYNDDIQDEHLDEGNDPFLEGAINKAATASVAVNNDNYDEATDGGTGGNNNDLGSQQQTRETTTTTAQAEQPTLADSDVNIMTDATETTDNMNFMAQRLRSLQRRRSSSMKRSMSSRRSSSNDNGLGDPESSGDMLMNALNSVDSSKNKSFLRKIRSEYNELIVPKIPKFQKNISHTLLFVVFPFLAVAALLFYMFDNPMVGESGTSVSWWILFLGVRQMLIFEFTRVGEVFWVEIFALRSRLFNMAVGPYVSMAFIQSKGWPYIVCFWAVLDFCFLYGSHPLPKHWLFWQNKLDLFNAGNPVVGVTDSNLYRQILLTCIFVGVTVSLKRLFLAIYLGRRTFSHFGSELEKLMAKMIIIGEVANLARDIESKPALFEGALSPVNKLGEDEKLVRFRELMVEENSSVEASPSPKKIQRKTLEVTNSNKSATPSPRMENRKVLEVPTPNSDTSTPKSLESSVSQGASPGHKHKTGHSPTRPVGVSSIDPATADGKKLETDSTANVKLIYLLSEWEEPELLGGTKSKATVRDLVEFRKAVAYMDDKYPFSHAFGHAKTRELCVQSSQEVYDRLMLSASDCTTLPFSILSVLGMDENGDFVDAKIKSLIRLFRPDRQGNLSRLDFVKSVDTVYKNLRLLRASIANSAQIDFAFERIINCFFYFFLAIVAVAILGFNDIWTAFLSFNTVFLAFSFLFGSAASNYFEGLLLIFVRRPYDIGDRIATSNPKTDTDSNGSSTWYVDKVSLFTTTVRFATTNEVATYSNGSLAVLRIINANRSPKAIISVLIKFGLETPFNKIMVFRTAVENFIKARPREWIALAGFRATRVEADYGYVEYKIVAQHRESWQNIGPVLQSKADLSSFCLEATKKLNMKYESPPMPVNLATSGNLDLSGIFHKKDDEPRGDIIGMAGGKGDAQKSMSAADLQDVANLFEIRKKTK